MPDLAKRPRGGWQVGGARSSQQRRPDYIPDGDVDDAYAVGLVPGEDAYIIKHYVVTWSGDTKTERYCCRAKVTINDRDRAEPYSFERVRGSMAALRRAQRQMDRKHGKGPTVD